MKFGVMGCRHGHVWAFIEDMLSMGHEFVGIYEKEGDLKDTLSKEFNVPVFDDVFELIKLKPEVVCSTSINSKKIDDIELCNKYGIHIMLDKPAVIDRDGFERLEKVVAENKIQIGMMLTERFNPKTIEVKRIIESGEIGDVVSFNFQSPHMLRKESREEWFFDKAQNGGLLIDLLIHHFDILMWLTGSEIEEVQGYIKKCAHNEYDSFYDSTNLVAKTKSGVIASMETSWWMPESYFSWGDIRLFCTGTKGRIEVRITGDAFIKKESIGFIVTNDNEIKEIGSQSSGLNLTEDFINRINGKESIITQQDIIASSKAVILADESVKVVRV